MRSGTLKSHSYRQGTPAWVIVPAVVALAFLVLPLLALAGRADWSTLWADVTSPASVQALWLSVWTAVLSTAICTVLGLPLASFIASLRPRPAAVLRAITTIPMLAALLGDARKNVGTLGVDAALLQLATHCWFEGGIEGYDRGQRDAREEAVDG